MPYKSIDELPDSVREALPADACKIFVAAFNSAHEQAEGNDEDKESRAMATAWAAVKRAGYVKGDSGKWEKKAIEKEYLPPGDPCVAGLDDNISLFAAVRKARDANKRWLLWQEDNNCWLYDVKRTAAIAKGKTLAGSYVPNCIPDDCIIAFVSASPTGCEAARRALLVGASGVVFEKQHLATYRCDRGQAAVLNAVPIYLTDDFGNARGPTDDEIAEWLPALKEELPQGVPVVALGRVAGEALDAIGVKHIRVPHPDAIVRKGDSGEVARKMNQLRRSVADGTAATQRINTSAPSDEAKTVRFIKADDPQGLVSAVVLEPDTVDAQGDVVTKQEIEKALVGFMTKPGKGIGYRHTRPTNAVIVENFLAPGDISWHGSPIRDGSWCMTVKVDHPRDKSEAMTGFLNAFSIGGLGKRTPRN